MKISILTLRWRYLSCLYIQRIGIQYTHQLFWKNNSLGTADIVFINKLQSSHFSDLRNWDKCMDNMFPCYSLLNVNAICLYMISAPPPIVMGWLNLKICQNIFLTFVAG